MPRWCDFQDLLAQNGNWAGPNGRKGGAMLTPTNSFLLLGVDSYVCATFGENRSRNATVRVHA